MIGTDLRVPARFAAFANGLAIHADDYDDTQLAVAKDRVYGLLTHPTAPALPPALALAERDRRSGADLMLAYQVGVEVECKVAEAILPRHYQHGFHSTATCGSIGAAAAAAKLLGLDREATRRALSHRRDPGRRPARELRHHDQALPRGPRRGERRRRRGDRRARLHRFAQRARGRPRLLPRGGRRLQPRDDRRQARQPVDLPSPGVSIKPHPTGSLTHPGMAVMLESRSAKHDIKPAQVKRVAVGTNHNIAARLDVVSLIARAALKRKPRQRTSARLPVWKPVLPGELRSGGPPMSPRVIQFCCIHQRAVRHR